MRSGKPESSLPAKPAPAEPATAAQVPASQVLESVLRLGEDLSRLSQRLAVQERPAAENLRALREMIVASVSLLIDAQIVVVFTPELVQRWTHTDPQLWETAQTEAAASQPASRRKQTAEIVAPLILRGHEAEPDINFGEIRARRAAKPPFSAAEIELLAALAIQSTLALQAELQAAIEARRRQQLALVHQVTLQIADLRGLDEIARRVTQLIGAAFDYECVLIYTVEPGKEALQLRGAAARSGENALQAADLQLQLGEGIAGYSAQTGREVVIPDVTVEPRYRRFETFSQTRSQAALPLSMHERTLGVLDVHSDRLDDFNADDLLVLRALAANIAVAVEDARLYAGLRRRAGQLELLYEVSSAITSILDQDALLAEVAEIIHTRFGFPFVHLYTVHPGRRKVVYEAGSGARDTVLRTQVFEYDLDDPHGIIPWVARSGQLVLANDVTIEPRYRPSPLPPEETCAELCVPLLFGEQILGVLDVQSERRDAFSQDDRFLFEALADHVAIALRNANLYRSEIWRRTVTDSLREVAGLLSAEVDLEQVLQAILAVFGRTLPHDLGAIWLIDATLEEPEADQQVLHLAAVQGEAVGGLVLEAGLTPEEVLEYNRLDVEAPSEGNPSDWLRLALAAEQPMIRSATSAYEPLGAALHFPEDYSAIAAPLRAGDRALGVLVLAQRDPGRYGSESRAMAEAFASSAAVAIENARLYESAHEQAWVSTVLLQVANATQTLTELNELLATVIHVTPMLAGVRACLLYIRDQDGDFVPAAASGLEQDAQAEFERWRFAPGDVTALDRLVVEKAPLFLHGDQDDRRLTGILADRGGDGKRDDLRLVGLVPMLARGEVLGAFLVDYSAGPAALSGRSLEAFFDERLAILQGIAQQTAIAVDNINLLKSQKEEAYVSVALLQVAQAVVSSNDLDETLGSIVRITPILVGVKRALIYLWDEMHHQFRLSQAYGMSRLQLNEPYPLGSFPLLDAVLVEDALLAHPLWNELSTSEDVPEVWTYLAAPVLDQVDEYLESAACLLLAFPLSVKGNVRGVLLVEEPEPAQGEGFGGMHANRRLRSKRLEIITGISQQAALAIENDLLQRETVERERLEREMQLAREIQNAFLPQALPEFAGWDLKVRWRTAREVGGDFYDFFELPGNRLGLVIADVADKGMPAALYSTLVRTLVRATVRELDSPADVLHRTNDIITPDSPHGMFVTIFYAVLDLDTGGVEFANAGHNHPLLLRSSTCAVEVLEGGGMALGVLEDIPIPERKTFLEPGDYLLLYTDGVTEAFSPEYEPFGEPRLHAAVLDRIDCGFSGLSAEDMLLHIDAAVQAFIGDGQPSDDLTMLLIRRSVD